ncbi:TSUP family transporter [bacterium]|nr:TSUP family transporter [bacterium]
MIPYLAVFIVSLLTAGLTMYSGFGLGTLLLPVFALFFPVEVAVGATAVVHGANNLFKVTLVGRHADKGLVLAFGVPAILAAFVGAAALGLVAHLEPLATYQLGPRTAVVTPVKLAVGILMAFFALFELLPRFRNLKFQKRHLPVGGLLSGFFGGFSGHQGALRSAFLVKTGVATEAFVGTNAVIGFAVDAMRIATYAGMALLAGASQPIGAEQWPLITTGIAAAFCGVLIGTRFLHKVTMRTVQTLTGVLLLGIAVVIGAGVI